MLANTMISLIVINASCQLCLQEFFQYARTLLFYVFNKQSKANSERAQILSPGQQPVLN